MYELSRTQNGTHIQMSTLHTHIHVVSDTLKIIRTFTSAHVHDCTDTLYMSVSSRHFHVFIMRTGHDVWITSCLVLWWAHMHKSSMDEEHGGPGASNSSLLRQHGICVCNISPTHHTCVAKLVLAEPRKRHGGLTVVGTRLGDLARADFSRAKPLSLAVHI